MKKEWNEGIRTLERRDLLIYNKYRIIIYWVQNTNIRGEEKLSNVTSSSRHVRCYGKVQLNRRI